jgi:hypothetical protein
MTEVYEHVLSPPEKRAATAHHSAVYPWNTTNGKNITEKNHEPSKNHFMGLVERDDTDFTWPLFTFDLPVRQDEARCARP